MPVLDLGLIFRTSPIDPDLIRGKSQPLFPSGGLHSSHQHPPPYLLSLSLSPSLITTYTISNSPYILCFFFVVAEGYWLKQASMSPYAGFSFQIWSSLVSDFRLKLKSYLCLRRIYVSWLPLAALASRTSHCSEVSWLTPIQIIWNFVWNWV